MKNLNLFLLFFLLSGNIMSQIVEVPYSGQEVTVIVSGSIYYPDQGPSTDDHIYGVVVAFNSNEQDGSANRAVILNGTNYHKPNPDTITFTSNIATHSLHIFAFDIQRETPGGLSIGEYHVEVNGINYVLDTSNVVYLLPCNTITAGTPSSLSKLDFINNLILGQNFPNPFVQSTTIDFFIEQRNHIKLDVYDNNGNLVCTLIDEVLERGNHSIKWDGTNSHGIRLTKGNYYYQITDGKDKLSKKMLILR